MVYDTPLVRSSTWTRECGEPSARRATIRDDSTWNVPEPEMRMSSADAASAGYTIGNDVSSRDMEYLPQAKIFRRVSRPAVLVPDPRSRSSSRSASPTMSSIVFEGECFTATMKRSFAELVEWLLIDNPISCRGASCSPAPAGPRPTSPSSPGHFVEIHVPEGVSAALVNPVVRASELIQKEPSVMTEILTGAPAQLAPSAANGARVPPEKSTRSGAPGAASVVTVVYPAQEPRSARAAIAPASEAFHLVGAPRRPARAAFFTKAAAADRGARRAGRPGHDRGDGQDPRGSPGDASAPPPSSAAPPARPGGRSASCTSRRSPTSACTPCAARSVSSGSSLPGTSRSRSRCGSSRPH